MPEFKVKFTPSDRSAVSEGKSAFLEMARTLDIGIASTCGGRGTCHKCRVRITKGTLAMPTPSETASLSREELDAGWRLACQSRPLSDCEVYLPADTMTSRQRMQIEAAAVDVLPEPAVKAYCVELTPPTLIDPEADADRLFSALEKQGLAGLHMDVPLIRRLPSLLRDHGWKCQALVRGSEIVGISPTGYDCLGLAIDLGTTKIAGYLVDLNSGKVIAKSAVLNPQASYGDDVISRIDAALKSPDNALNLSRQAVEAVNGLAASLCQTVKSRPEDIVDAVIVGNTAIHHLLLGLPVRQLATAPYVPVIRDALDLKAREIGLAIVESAYVHIPANIAGFVGADHTAALLSANAPGLEELTVLVDIGTNTEISLINNGAISCVSCASGPAFEGGHIEHGMRAGSGAIERFSIDSDGVRYQTIDDAPPVGICGSGIVDSIAAMYLNGIIDRGGRMQPGHSLVISGKHGLEFVIEPGKEAGGRIVITQPDVREVQLAKAAIRTGISILLQSAGIKESDIGRILLAGAFGSYIDIESAITIGMLPPLALDRFKQVGNASGAGAILALVSTEKRQAARMIAAGVRYIEMAALPSFNDTFLKSSYLGKYSLDQD
jgi:uncharacterized 2Fe-2S/4Fe-4S cluster protein (DUF4445 family)